MNVKIVFLVLRVTKIKGARLAFITSFNKPLFE